MIYLKKSNRNVKIHEKRHVDNVAKESPRFRQKRNIVRVADEAKVPDGISADINCA